MKSISLKLSNTLAAKLETAARKRHASKSVLVREALEAYLLNGRRPQPPSGSFLDLAGDLIGSLDSGEGDLSYNPKHMEGFGR